MAVHDLDGVQLAAVAEHQALRRRTTSAYYQAVLDRAIDFALSPGRHRPTVAKLVDNTRADARKAMRREWRAQTGPVVVAYARATEPERATSPAVRAQRRPDSALVARDLRDAIARRLRPEERACLAGMLVGATVAEMAGALRRSVPQVERYRAAVRRTAAALLAQEAA